MSEEKIVSNNDEMQLNKKEARSVNLGRHQAQCTVCSSPYREQIEEEFINWGYTRTIGEASGVSRDSIYRHAHALDLFNKRQKNVKFVLEKIMERVNWAPVSASQIVSAFQAYVKFISSEKGTEPAQGTNPKELLERMSQEEREAFARDGSLPDWFSGGKGATPGDGQESEKEVQVTETKMVQ
jgi:hypothetical protein